MSQEPFGQFSGAQWHADALIVDRQIAARGYENSAELANDYSVMALMPGLGAALIDGVEMATRLNTEGLANDAFLQHFEFATGGVAVLGLAAAAALRLRAVYLQRRATGMEPGKRPGATLLSAE